MTLLHASASAGPGPSTLAIAARPKPERTSSLPHAVPLPVSPVSILRKPSLPTISAPAQAPAASTLPTPTTAASSSMPSTPSGLSFPPLPPLPPYPLVSSSSKPQRKSAPPTSPPSRPADGNSGGSRVKTRRSRVSFREEVDVAAPADLPKHRPQAVQPAPQPPARPASAAAGYISGSPAARRPSADGDIRKMPRPVLKRVASSSLMITRPVSANDFDAFRPQTLRYPRVSPALARLSDSTFNPADVWDTNKATRAVKRSSASSVPSAPVSAITSLSSSSSSATSSPVVATQDHRGAPAHGTTPSVTATPPARKSRKPRSPVPSWGSTCPSLISSSHRASLASTLTAPSMTSLLLSPPSPGGDRASSFPDDIYGSPRTSPMVFAHDADAPELPEMPDLATLSKLQQSADSSDYTQVVSTSSMSQPSKLRLQPAPRVRRREPSTASTTPTESPAASKPRATERLLRLQSSLADLRMQRQSDSPVPPPLPSPPLPRSRKAPPSPTVAELAHATPRKSEWSSYREPEESDSESDLDLSLPLLNAALRSHVIPSSSRLLVQSSRKAKLADGEADTSLGWSGSESEEEEFSRTVARITLRKAAAATSAVPPPASRRLLHRPSLPVGRLHRFSQLSPPSDSSTGPTTPRPSSAMSSSSRSASGTAAMLSALVESKYGTSEALPRPKRFVEGWGAPEVLHDDDWPPDAVEEVDEDDEMPVPRAVLRSAIAA
ncbi:hypothetical protein Q8F55_004092 [Vanrija albida]|uniref:Proteophosphoglycan ppg4 n=1 Tax=Vanrija albida TaxID=181172 RepID=A0ABR3Q5U5_9TREE